jgi:hypothetical protein
MFMHFIAENIAYSYKHLRVYTEKYATEQTKMALSLLQPMTSSTSLHVWHHSYENWP